MKKLLVAILCLLATSAQAVTYTTIQMRRDTPANWALYNPVLAAGEPACEMTGTPLRCTSQKVGDGVTTWSALPYAGNSAWVDSGGYSSLAAAAAYAVSSNKALHVTRQENINSDMDLSAVPEVDIIQGGSFNIASGKVLKLPVNFRSGITQVFYGSGSVSGLRWAYPDLFGKNVTPGTTDMTNPARAAAAALSGGTLRWTNDAYRITGKISFANAGIRGSYILQGEGASTYTSASPTTFFGTTLIWDGSATDSMFEFGSTPLYIAGVVQSFDQAQFNNQINDLSIIVRTGIKSVVYAHDGDGFQVSRVYVNGFNNTDIRGVFDFRGSINNVGFKQVTVFNVPNGYGVRGGDGFTNVGFDQVFMEHVALHYWIGDTATYETPYQNGMITWRDGTHEGLSGTGKFSVSTLTADAASAVTSITVADGTKFAAGDPIYIDKGTDLFEMNRITGVAGNVVSLAYPLDYSHLLGAPVKAGSIAVHAGTSGPSNGRTTSLNFDRPMIDRVGCFLDISFVEGIQIKMPTVASNVQRLLYLDGDTQNIHLENPRVLPGQLTSWRIFEVTNRGNVFDFLWLFGADKSGVSQPYINNQGDINGFYMGSFAQTGGTSTFPAYFRGITADAIQGVVIRETDNALGLKYITGTVGSENTNFEVTPSGDIHGVNHYSRWGFITSTPDGLHQYRISVNDSGTITSTLVP